MTLFGIITDSKEKQSLNKPSLIIFIFDGNIIFLSDEHPENAYFPITVTLFGIIISVRVSHPEKAEFSILLICFDKITLFNSLFFKKFSFFY